MSGFTDQYTCRCKLAFKDVQGRRLFACSLSAIKEERIWEEIIPSDTVVVRTDGAYWIEAMESISWKFKKMKNIVFLVSQDYAVNHMLDLGYNVSYLPESAFLKYEAYPEPDFSLTKDFIAVINSTGHKCKRTDNVPVSKNIAVITYDGGDSKRIEDLGFGYINSKVLNRYEVFDVNSRSGCGLVLSFNEGIPRAMIEYLLCGIPVVSTMNVCGRDYFLNSRNSLMCHPSSDGVLNAIEEANSKIWDRQWIRSKVISDIDKLRSSVKDILKHTPIGNSTEFNEAFNSLISMDYMGGYGPVKIEDLFK